MRFARPAMLAAALAPILSVGAPLAAAAQGVAPASDPAAQQVDKLDGALLAAMKAGKSTTVQDRYKRLAPVVTRVFDFPRMIRFASGVGWTKMSAADQKALVTAFTRYSVASYAHNFDAYSGQAFVLERVDTRLPDKLVRTQLTSPGATPVILSYRMEKSGDGQWRIIDVYFNGAISELAQQSSDFASTLAAGGAPALVKKLNDQSDKLLAGG